MNRLDCLLSGFRRYRRWRGGWWFMVYELPFIQGGFTYWCRRLFPEIPGELLAVEDYETGAHIYGLNVPKRFLAPGRLPAADWR